MPLGYTIQSIINEQILNNLSELSYKIGKNIHWTQAAGGNLAQKTDAGIFIKASGFKFKDALEQNIFTFIPKNELQIEPFLQERVKNLTPSMELPLHQNVPGKITLHTHDIFVQAACLSLDRDEIFKTVLKDFNFSLIPYAMPGEELANTLKLNQQNQSDVFILQNHGLLISGNSESNVFEKMFKISNALKLYLEEKNNLRISIPYDLNNFDFLLESTSKLPFHINPDFTLLFSNSDNIKKNQDYYDVLYSRYLILNYAGQINKNLILSDDDVFKILNSDKEKQRVFKLNQ